MWRKQIVHHNKVDFLSICDFHSVKTVKLGYERVRISFHVGVIVSQYFPQEFVFGMVNGLNDILVVPRKVEEAATFTRRAEFREYVLAGQRHEVVRGIELEFCSQVTKYPRRIVFEFEVVFGGWSQFVTSAI